jgi:hypothetical protein
MAFDPFGVSVKDLRTGVLLLRCNIDGDLYPLYMQASLMATCTCSTCGRHLLLGRTKLSLLHPPPCGIKGSVIQDHRRPLVFSIIINLTAFVTHAS